MPVCGLNYTHGLVPYRGWDKEVKNAAHPPEGSLVETRCLINGPKSAIVPFPGPGARHLFEAASHQTRLDTRSKARRPIKVGMKWRGRSGTSRDTNPACLCCSSAHLVQFEPDEASSFTNPNVVPGTYAS